MMKPVNQTQICFPSNSVNESFGRAAVSAFLAQLDPTVSDLTELKTAVSEAVTNAIVHGYPDAIGGVTLKLRCLPENVLELTVRDRGRGLSQQVRQALQNGSPIPLSGDDTRGMGIGLSVCQSIIKAHGGFFHRGKPPGWGRGVPLRPACGGGGPPRSKGGCSMSEKQTILIIEDERAISNFISRALTANDYRAIPAYTGKEGLSLFFSHGPDLVLLDIMMPKMDGYEMVETLRARGDTTPVIMLTAKDTLTDKGQGFMVGCDDYITKPVNFEELIWRIDAILRRYKIANEGKIIIGGVTVDKNSFTVTFDDRAEELPTKEFQLLYLLLSYPEKIFTYEQILDKVWGFESESGETTVRTHINRLRNKFEGVKEFEIITIRGMGYKAVINK